MSNRLFIVIALLAALLGGAAWWWTTARPGNTRLLKAVQTMLQKHGLYVRDVAVDGGVVTLSGPLDARANHKRLRDVVADIAGVSDVTDATESVQMQRPHLHLQVFGGIVTLSGTLPAPATVKALLAKLKTTYGAASITNQIRYDPQTAHPAWLAALTDDIGTLITAEPLTLDAKAGTVAISGLVADADQRHRLLDALRTSLPTEVHLREELRVPGALASARLTIIRDGDSLTFKGRLPPGSALARFNQALTSLPAALHRKIDVANPPDTEEPGWLDRLPQLLAALAQFHQASLRLDDQGITLSGRVADNAQKRTIATAITDAAGGVLSVQDELVVDDSLKTAQLIVDIDHGKAVITGRLPDTAAIHRVLGAADLAFGPQQVTDRLIADPAITAPVWLEAAIDRLQELTDAAIARLSADASGIHVSGRISRPAPTVAATTGVGPLTAPALSTTLTTPAAALAAPVTNDAATVRAQIAGLDLGSVQFASGQARLATPAPPALDQAAAIMKTATGQRFEIAGYTDSVGKLVANLALSQARAKAVRDALIARGITAGQLTARGYGEAQPIADNNTAAGRAANRRIEIMVR